MTKKEIKKELVSQIEPNSNNWEHNNDWLLPTYKSLNTKPKPCQKKNN